VKSGLLQGYLATMVTLTISTFSLRNVFILKKIILNYIVLQKHVITKVRYFDGKSVVKTTNTDINLKIK